MATHYDTAILPARPRRPRDKAKVEVAVLIIERWLLGRLRHRRFYSLAELNTAIGELLRQLNDERPIRRLGVTRRALFEELDRPNLNSLPAQPYCFAEWRVRRVGVDYHSLPPRSGGRARRSFLQRAPPLCAQRGGGAADPASRRDLSEGRTDRRSSARQQ
jgi:hypothetical protein